MRNPLQYWRVSMYELPIIINHSSIINGVSSWLPKPKIYLLPVYLVYIFYSLLSSLYICRESSTNSPLFMQNKANLPAPQMNVTSFYTVDYENKFNWKLGENKANTNPIQTQTNPIFRMVKNDAMCVFTKDYEEKCG